MPAKTNGQLKGPPKRAWKATVFRQNFINCYDGRGGPSAEKAGYRGTPNYLKTMACRLLKIPQIKAAIEERFERERSALIADRTEREERLTAILRNNKVCELPGSEAGAEIGETPEGEKKIVRLAVDTKDQIKAIDILNKMDGLYITKLKLEEPHEAWVEAIIKHGNQGN